MQGTARGDRSTYFEKEDPCPGAECGTKACRTAAAASSSAYWMHELQGDLAPGLNEVCKYKDSVKLGEPTGTKWGA